MSDDNSEKPKALDISKLQGGGLSKEAREAIQKSTAGLGGVNKEALKAAERATAGFGAVGDVARIKALLSANAIQPDIADKIKGVVAAQNIAESLQKQIAGLERYDRLQQEDDFLRGPNIAAPHTFRNPVVDRLERIENQFESLGGVAREGLGAGLALQARADQFLGEFREAAEDTTESGRAAVEVGKSAAQAAKRAIWIALAIGAAQILLALFTAFGPNKSAAALEANITAMQGEIVRLRGEQEQTSQKLIDALARGDQATASAVREALKQVKPAVREALKQVKPAAPISDNQGK